MTGVAPTVSKEAIRRAYRVGGKGSTFNRR
jgi:hypothetical protein